LRKPRPAPRSGISRPRPVPSRSWALPRYRASCLWEPASWVAAPYSCPSTSRGCPAPARTLKTDPNGDTALTPAANRQRRQIFWDHENSQADRTRPTTPQDKFILVNPLPASDFLPYCVAIPSHRPAAPSLEAVETVQCAYKSPAPGRRHRAHPGAVQSAPDAFPLANARKKRRQKAGKRMPARRPKGSVSTRGPQRPI